MGSGDKVPGMDRASGDESKKKAAIVGGGGGGVAIVGVLLALTLGGNNNSAPNNSPNAHSTTSHSSSSPSHHETAGPAPSSKQHSVAPPAGKAACGTEVAKLDVTEATLQQLDAAAHISQNAFEQKFDQLSPTHIPCDVEGISGWYDGSEPAQQDTMNDIITTVGDNFYKTAMVGGALRGTAGQIEFDPGFQQ